MHLVGTCDFADGGTASRIAMGECVWVCKPQHAKEDSCQGPRTRGSAHGLSRDPKMGTWKV